MTVRRGGPELLGELDGERRPGPPQQLVELAVSRNEVIRSLSVQTTTLDDVFVHYTGRQLRDEQVKALNFVMPPRPGIQP